ncbi:MAG: hypothetical protein WA765_12960 [Candidatus Acidiferrum sp.]
MARLFRIVVVNVPHHVAQRGNARQFQEAETSRLSPTCLLGGASGTNITGQTINVVVGEQIVLYASYGSLSATSQSWNIPGYNSNPPTAISNFVVNFSTPTSSGGPVALTAALLGQQSASFYFVAPGNSQLVTFTLHYNVNGTAQTGKALVTFNVAGPTSVSVSPSPRGSVQFIDNGTTSAQIELGDADSTPAITLNATGSPPPPQSGPPLNGTPVTGTFEWAQIINNNSYTYKVGTTITSCSGPTGLDNFLPLLTGFVYEDSPERPLPSADNEFTWAWSATTYFFWIPGIAGNNTIAVPLGSVSWSFNADATQTISTNTWTLQTSSSSNGVFQASANYPSWSTVAKNDNPIGCP